MTDETWAEFRQSIFGDPYMVWHDGPDFDALRERAKADPAEVERQLLAGLSAGDGLAAEAMGEVGTSAQFAEALEAALPRSVGGFRVDVAQALIALTSSEEEWAPALIDVLVAGGVWNDRMDSAIAIGKLTPTIALIGALMVGINDSDYLVRYHSCNAMLAFAGTPSDISSHSELFDKILDGTPPSGRKAVAAELSKSASARLSAR